MEQNREVDYSEGYKVNLHDEIIYVDAEKVTRELMEYIEEYEDIDDVFFTKKVKEFCDGAFKGMNMGRVHLFTATEVETIGRSCFERAYNIDGRRCFSKVTNIGEGAFRSSLFVAGLDMPIAREIPAECFKDAILPYLNIENASSIHPTAFDGVIIKDKENSTLGDAKIDVSEVVS